MVKNKLMVIDFVFTFTQLIKTPYTLKIRPLKTKLVFLLISKILNSYNRIVPSLIRVTTDHMIYIHALEDSQIVSMCLQARHFGILGLDSTVIPCICVTICSNNCVSTLDKKFLSCRCAYRCDNFVFKVLIAPLYLVSVSRFDRIIVIALQVESLERVVVF